MRKIPSVYLKYELHPIVKSIRDGWQWTCTSGAVVSGLVAGGAAQLLSTFKGDPVLLRREPRDRNLVLILCYAAIFLNISATIGSFILTDNLGEIEYIAAQKPDPFKDGNVCNLNEEEILKEYGASSHWNCMLLHWLITFYCGILSLIMSVLSFVWLVESRAIAITMSIIVAFTLIPVSYFILLRPFLENICASRAQQRSTTTAPSSSPRTHQSTSIRTQQASSRTQPLARSMAQPVDSQSSRSSRYDMPIPDTTV